MDCPESGRVGVHYEWGGAVTPRAEAESPDFSPKHGEVSDAARPRLPVRQVASKLVNSPNNARFQNRHRSAVGGY